MMMAPTTVTAGSRPPLRLSYAGCPPLGQDRGKTTILNAPWLAGRAVDELFARSNAGGESNGFATYEAGGLLFGYGQASLEGGRLAAAARDLYLRMFLATRGLHVYRIWNYVPRINQVEVDLENYRAFCQGRSLAFEEAFGTEFARELSAASAVGCGGNAVQLVFAAGLSRGRHFENPAQVPAYRYPTEHGPRSPSFARATVASGDGRRYVFVSGTAAIKGHMTIAPGDIIGQIDCTLDNLRLISREVGVGDRLGADEGWERHFKVYLRRPRDLTYARMRLEPDWIRVEDKATYLHADICRSALHIEIEATLVKPLR
jgi:enamine deaminase RidA (YjgF/YER057c/UK114 family)